MRTTSPRLGAALFTVFVKGADFLLICNAQCTKKGRIGIGQWGNRMEDKKTRTFEKRKIAAPEIQKHSKAGAPGNPPSLGSQKIAHGKSSLAENGPQRSLRHVARMMRDRNFPSGFRMALDLMTACTRAVEAKSERTKASCNFTVAKSRQAPHQGIMTGTRNSRAGTCRSRNAAGSGSPCSRQDTTIFRARL